MNILHYLSQFNLDEKELKLMEQLGEEITISSGQDISCIGRKADFFYFIESGFVRAYRINDGDEFTTSFYVPQDIFVDYESIINSSESQLYFQALAPTKTVRFRYSQVENLFEDHPRIERIARKIAESAYIKLTERVREFQQETLEHRYLNLVEHHEDIFRAAPLQHIASYLGVKPQSLSRIRSQIIKK